LNYKDLDYDTVWVEYHEIEVISKQLGVKPTGVNLDGSDLYTIPIIHDRSTGVALSESLAIAQYLDTTYPATPRLVPDGTYGLLAAFDEAMLIHLSPMFQFNLPKSYFIVNDVSADYFRTTREAQFGKSFQEVFPGGQRAEAEWKKIEAGWEHIAKWYKDSEPFIAGNAPTFADFKLLGFLFWTKRVWGEESAEYRRILDTSAGRWRKLVEALKKYDGGL
jgi:glutathione S-transferase